MRKNAAAFFVGVLIALIPIGAAGQDVEVTKVSFDGNWLFPEKKLHALIQTKSVGRFKKHIMRREPYFYSETVLAADIARVERFYQTEGYLGVEIAPPVLRFSGSGKSVKITIPIKEGKPVRVRSVTRLWDLSRGSPGASSDSTAGSSAAVRETAYFEGLIDETAISASRKTSGFATTRSSLIGSS
jgi:hypothetical protein